LWTSSCWVRYWYYNLNGYIQGVMEVCLVNDLLKLMWQQILGNRICCNVN